MGRPRFAYPFTGSYPVSSPYGPRNGGFHTGTDFGVPASIPILASNDGTVIYAAYEGGAGNTVTISGEDGWQSRYHHLERWTVYVGEPVHAGDLIGYCDSTGSSTGPHLHFEIRPTPATTTDPIPILEADAAGSAPGPTPLPDPIPQWEDDVMMIVNTERGAAILLSGHRPRKIESVNSYAGPVVWCTNDAWDQWWWDAIAIYNATVGEP
jgi:murein DD-endopeptidase MepM/ murein hydrolase activator NlpD